MKWALVVAGISDLKRPVEKVSLPTSVALALTGCIWMRYSFVIVPKNYNLFAVNLFVAITGGYQIYRKIAHDMAKHTPTVPVLTKA